MNKPVEVIVVGAGLAGCEAAWYLAAHGVKVKLYEVKSVKKNPAQKTDGFAELVCSNSLRGRDLTQGVGLLKEELKLLGSLVMEAALATEVPAGGALAVDRDLFSQYITDKIRSSDNIEIIENEFREIDPDQLTIVATGPLTSGSLLASLTALVGTEFSYFSDASAPIVAADSIDYQKAYFASRYGKGNMEDYLNCPMDKVEYEAFYSKLISAEGAEKHLEEEKEKYFEGCMPIEELARRGIKTLLFGPLKPVGLGLGDSRPYGVVQLRAENQEKSMYNLVGFQTGLKFSEQRELISLIPGLESAEILRYGVIHRNTFINSPMVLNRYGFLNNHNNVFVAGQISGVEGYLESATSGLYVGWQVLRKIKDLSFLDFPQETMLASMFRYITSSVNKKGKLEPMNANFGLLPLLSENIRDKKEKKLAMAKASLVALKDFIGEVNG